MAGPLSELRPGNSGCGRFVGSGLVLGLAAAFGLSRYVASQLYGVTPNDPTTIVVAVAGLAAAALLAAYIPSRRATAVNPVLALRYE